MKRRFPWFFLTLSIAFFVFVVGLTGYRIDEARKRNAALAQEGLPTIAQKAQTLRDVAGGYAAPQFGREMRTFFDSQPRLLLLSIHSADSLLYVVSRDRGLLTDPAEPSAQWHGTPSYAVNRGYDLLLSIPLDSSGGAATLDALFVIMGREDLYPVVRDDLYLFLAFLLVCGVALLIVFSVQQEPIPGRAPAQPEVPPRAAPREQVRESQPGPREPAVREARAPEAPLRSLTSPRTGLVWAEHLDARLRAELERAAAANQDLACARVRIDRAPAGPTLAAVYTAVAATLREAFPLHDLLFESGDDSFTVVVPDTGVDAAVRLMEELRAKVSASGIEGEKRTVSAGVSSRGGRLVEHPTLLEEADTALDKAVREGGDQVIGFRADASRFRQLLTETAS